MEKKKKERKSKKKNMWKPKRFYDNEVYTPGWRLMILVMMMVFSLAASIYYLVDRSNGNQNLQAACADCNKRLNHANLNHSKLQFLTEQEQKENEKQFARPYEHWSNYRITATNTSSSTSVAGQSVSTDDSVGIFSFGNTNIIGVSDGSSSSSVISMKTTGQVIYVPDVTLTRGSIYYHDDSGILTTTSTSNRAGIAISAHQLLVLLF